MLLYNEKDIRYEITIKNKEELEKNTTFQSLLSNLENHYQIDEDTFQMMQDKMIKITTYDNRSGDKIKTIWF